MRDKLKSGGGAGSDTFQIEMHNFARQLSRIQMLPVLLVLKSTTKQSVRFRKQSDNT